MSIAHITQRQLWRPAEHPDGPQRGDCFRACVASIFAVSYEDAEGIDGGDSATLAKWVRERIPGVRVQHRILIDLATPATLDSYETWPVEHWEYGYWIASVWSPRIPDVERFDCGCAYDADGQPCAPDPHCRWCHGDPGSRSMGVDWGLHAVVMSGRNLAWDPHPARTGKVGPFYSAITFAVSDPASLLAAIPQELLTGEQP